MKQRAAGDTGGADAGRPIAPALEARLSVAVGRPGSAFAVEAELALDRGVLVLFGPSGAGKSLTLQALAGLLRPLRGCVRVSGQTLYDSERAIWVPVHRRRVGYVPQHHSLFPFRDVAANVAFGLPRAERRRDSPRVRALLEELGLAQLADARPDALSGGERQRVALARALVVQPRLLLLDEPFASIDQEGRALLRHTLRETLDRHGIPAVFVTHDPDEALALGDRLVRFERGHTTLAGAPGSLLRRGHPVVVAGQAAGPARALEGGRAEIALSAATVEAPAELLEPGEGGQVRLDLRTRPREK
ncbi:MAG TPA: ATP-binding cassette domain-containing protein [Polyangia bacterium]|nr:ATP-binding cassette domain-containing protein [Polyangia bacterium]